MSADVTAFVDHAPSPGETRHGDRLSLVLGGKGANQAIAAARSGAPVELIGCVGDDLFRDVVLDGLRSSGVGTSGVTTVPGSSGVAHIRVDRSTGQNDIVIVAGANAALTPDLAERQLRAAAPVAGDVVLLQLEVPVETALRAAQIGAETGATVVLDPAPAAELPSQLWDFVDAVTPNETEASGLTGLRVTDAATARQAIDWFSARGVAHPIVTLAERGLVALVDGVVVERPVIPVDVVDSTAAGDAFAGALGAALAGGSTWDEAIERGIAAGAYAVTVEAASPSLPTSEQIDDLLARRRR